MYSSEELKTMERWKKSADKKQLEKLKADAIKSCEDSFLESFHK